MAQKISQVEGVGLVSVSGGQRPAVRVVANVRALAAYGLNIDDLRTTIANANVNAPKGTLDGPARSWTLNANDQIQDPNDYKNIIVAYKNGNPVRLSDVADVIAGAENTYLAGWVNNSPGIILNIQRQPGANVIQVVDRIKALLPSLTSALPAAVEVTVLTDRTNTIRASVHDVEFELGLAVALVVMVIFLFLRSIPATIIPSMSVPLSLIGTLAVMYLLGFSLDNLSLMALTIATGFVVDDAIVMIENISRYIEQGEPPLQAALKGAGEIGFTIVSLTVSLIAVLIPLLFMGDVVGRLFHEFAITLAVTIVISAVVSLTLVPMMCAKLLHHTEPRHRVAHRALVEREVPGAHRPLRSGAQLGARAPAADARWWRVATLALTIALYIFIPKGFFPVQDTGVIQAITEAPQSVSFADMSRRQAQLAGRHPQGPGRRQPVLVHRRGRHQHHAQQRPHADQPQAGERALADGQPDHPPPAAADRGVTGISLYMQPVQDLSIADTVSRTQYQFVLEDANPDEFNTWVPKLVAKLQTLPQLEDVASDQENQGLSAYLTIDRDTAGRFGITPATVDNALYDAFGQRIVSTIFTQSNQYRVILQADDSLMASLDALGTIYLPSSTAIGGEVPLSALVKVSERTAPLSIDHLGQFPATTVSFNLAPGAALGTAVDAIKQAEKDIAPATERHDHLPGRGARLSGDARQRAVPDPRRARHRVHRARACSTRASSIRSRSSRRCPRPASARCSRCCIAGSDLGVIGIIGIVLLIGIVKKNAIMMIDFALVAEREQGMSPRDAIYHASLLRFRPILMTTMAALLGALPLMLGTGTGSELRHPLGHHHRRRPDSQSAADALHHAGDLPVLRSPRAAHQRPHRAGGAAERSGDAMNLSEPFIRRPVATTLLTFGIALAGALAYFKLPVSPLPQVDFPTISVSAQHGGRKSGRHGGHRRDAARAPPRADCRRHRDDLLELHRLEPRHAAVWPEPQHRRRRARRRGRHQRRARRPAHRAAQQSDLPQGEPGRRADHDPDPDLRRPSPPGSSTTRPTRSSRRSSPR